MDSVTCKLMEVGPDLSGHRLVVSMLSVDAVQQIASRLYEGIVIVDPTALAELQERMARAELERDNERRSRALEHAAMSYPSMTIAEHIRRNTAHELAVSLWGVEEADRLFPSRGSP